MSLRLTVAFE